MATLDLQSPLPPSTGAGKQALLDECRIQLKDEHNVQRRQGKSIRKYIVKLSESSFIMKPNFSYLVVVSFRIQDKLWGVEKGPFLPFLRPVQPPSSSTSN